VTILEHAGTCIESVTDVVSVKNVTPLLEGVQSVVHQIGNRAFPASTKAGEPDHATFLPIETLAFLASDGVFVPVYLNVRILSHGTSSSFGQTERLAGR